MQSVSFSSLFIVMVEGVFFFFNSLNYHPKFIPNFIHLPLTQALNGLCCGSISGIPDFNLIGRKKQCIVEFIFYLKNTSKEFSKKVRNECIAFPKQNYSDCEFVILKILSGPK